MSQSLQALAPSEVKSLLTPLLGDRAIVALDKAEALRRIVSCPRRLDAVGAAHLGDGEGLVLYCRLRTGAVADGSADPAVDATGSEHATLGCERQIVIDLPRGRYLVETLDASGRTVGLESAEGGPMVCGFPDLAHDLVLVIRQVRA